MFMTTIADHHPGHRSSAFHLHCTSGSQVYPRTSKDDIAHLSFKVVEVIGDRSSFRLGSHLVVCYRSSTSYWVWANAGVTGIEKEQCRDLSGTMPLREALAVRAAMAPSKQRDRLAAELT